MQLVQAAYERQSQSPTELMGKVAKSASTAWGLVALQTQRIAELEAANKYLQKKEKRTLKQIQHGGILEVRQAQQLILERDNAAEQERNEAVQRPRQRAPPTCSGCHIQGHTIRQCRNIERAS